MLESFVALDILIFSNLILRFMHIFSIQYVMFARYHDDNLNS